MTATNAGGSATQGVSVTENPAPPLPSGSVIPKTGLTNVATTVDMSTYFTGVSLVYTVSSNPQSSAAISGSILTITPNYRNATYAVIVTATNAGGSAIQSVSVTEISSVVAPANNGTVPAQTGLKNVAATVNMASYFTGVSMVYTVTSNPQSNATISAATLTIVPNFRATTYTVIVTATNAGGSTTQSISVTETVPPPVNVGSNPIAIPYGTGVNTINLSSYFSGGVTLYTCWYSPDLANTSLNTSTGVLTVTAAYRNTTYQIQVGAQNAGGVANILFINITESAAPMTRPKYYSIPTNLVAASGNYGVSTPCGQGISTTHYSFNGGPTWSSSGGGILGALAYQEYKNNQGLATNSGQFSVPFNYGTNGGGTMVFYVNLLGYTSGGGWQFEMMNSQTCTSFGSAGHIMMMVNGTGMSEMNATFAAGAGSTAANPYGATNIMPLNTWEVLVQVITPQWAYTYLNGTLIAQWNGNSPVFSNFTQTQALTNSTTGNETTLDMKVAGEMFFDYPMNVDQVTRITNYFTGMTNANYATQNQAVFGLNTP